MNEITTIGLDLAKQISADVEGAPVISRKLRRADMLSFFRKTPRCLVGLEACGGAHYWAREIAALGHEVRLIPPAYVKPYVKRGKTDAADAEAICEAVTRKTMRFVPVKSADQQAAATSEPALVARRLRVVHSVTTRWLPPYPASRRRRHSSAPFRQPPSQSVSIAPPSCRLSTPV